jgi:hypothetical protein
MRTINLKNKQAVYIFVLMIVAFFGQSSLAGEAPIVSTDKAAYNYGDTIKVNFSGSPGRKLPCQADN